MMVFPSIVNREDTDGIVRRVSDVNVLDPTVDLDGCLGCRAYSDKRCINMQRVVYTLILFRQCRYIFIQ